MDKHRLLEELKENPKNIRFGRLCTIAEAFGFTLRVLKEAIKFMYAVG